MQKYDGEKFIAATVALAVIGAMQVHGGLIDHPIQPSTLGWLLIGFAAVLLVSRATVRAPVPCFERRTVARPA